MSKHKLFISHGDRGEGVGIAYVFLSATRFGPRQAFDYFHELLTFMVTTREVRPPKYSPSRRPSASTYGTRLCSGLTPLRFLRPTYPVRAVRP